jgi:chromosome segregation ATPase
MAIPVLTGEADTLLALLKSLSDPKQVEATLKRISEAQKKADDSIAESQQLAAETNALSHKVSALQTEVLKKDKALTDEKAEIVKIQQSLQNQHDEFDRKVAKMGEQLAAAGRLEAAARSRDEQSRTREEQLQQAEAKLQKSIAEHKAWLKSIKPPG